MSRQLALDTINLKPVTTLAHTDYSVGYHTEYLEKLTGLKSDAPEFESRWHDLWEMDFIWFINDGLYGSWKNFGRQTDMGHASYSADGADKHDAHESPFKDEEEVWAFDAVTEYGLPAKDDQIAAYEKIVQKNRRQFPNQLVTGGYYKTIVSGAIEAFGWDMLLIALSEPDKMEKVFDSFFRRTLFHMESWAATSVDIVIQHDDFVWTSGAFMNPEIYRNVIIPRYAELWKPLHAAGKKVLFCADGNFMEFAEDVVRAGADGLIFEPCNDFEWMVERFGSEVALIGSAVDCRDLTFNKWEKVQSDMNRTFELSHKCKGLIFATGNHLPANIPAEMMDKYINYFREHRQR